MSKHQDMLNSVAKAFGGTSKAEAADIVEYHPISPDEYCAKCGRAYDPETDESKSIIDGVNGAFDGKKKK